MFSVGMQQMPYVDLVQGSYDQGKSAAKSPKLQCSVR